MFAGESRSRRWLVLGSVGAVLILAVSSLTGAFLGFGSLPSDLTGGSGSASAPPASGSSAPVLTTAAAAVPLLTVYPTSAVVGQTVQFNGTGFPHSAVVNISSKYWSTAVCAGKTTSTGTFTCQYTVAPTPGGNQGYMMVVGADSNTTILTIKPHLILSPASGLVGTIISFGGTGFGGVLIYNKTHVRIPVQYGVVVNWTLPTGSSAQACEGQTDASDNGTFVCNNTYVLPAVAYGAHTFYASSTNLTLSGSAPFDVVAGLSVGPSYGPTSTQVTFSGSGFPSASVVGVTWSPSGITLNACSGTALNIGTFSCTYAIPYGTVGGQYTFKASNSSVSATTTFYVSSLAVSPVAATVGTMVNFTGAGFPSSAALGVNWSGGNVGSCLNTSAAGTFRCAFVVPATPAGSYVFNASAGKDYATVALTVGPSLAINRSYGDPGTPVLFTGAGFGGGLPVTVAWSPNGTPLTACSGTTSSSGAFSCDFALPSWAAGGPHTFTATDRAGNAASTGFTVTYLSLNPSSAAEGTTITVTAGGFAPGSAVTWSYGGLSFGCLPETASAQGGFQCTYTTKSAPAGTYVTTAKDSSNDQASANFTVTPSLAASVARGQVGITIKFTATGFAAGATVTVAWGNGNGTVACSATASVNGGANCSYALPSTPAGTYTFVGTDPDQDMASVAFLVVPSLSVTPTSGLAGTIAKFTGLGFGAKTLLNVTSSLGVACGQVTTNTTGGFVCTYTVPSAPSGVYLFKAVDTSSNAAETNFTVQPALTASSLQGIVGQLVTFTGAGFAAGKIANVSWSPSGTSEVACSGTVSGSGSFSCTYSLPAIVTGTYTFKASTGSGASASLNFLVVPSLSVSPAAGPVGTAVTFYGRGYASGILVAVTGLGLTACSGTTGSNGSFDCPYSMPDVASGVHEFTGTYSSLSATTNFTVRSVLTVAPRSGAVGTTVTLNGTGFAASTEVTVSSALGTACQVPSASSGDLSCTYLIPSGPAGTYTFIASVGGTPVATANFTLTPSLIVYRSSGPVGTKVTFTATGFAASSEISIVSGYYGTVCQSMTLANGTYVCPFTFGPGPAGSYTFKATDASNNNASATFVLGTTLTVSPAIGPVDTPLEFNGTGFAASTAVTVSWSGGTVCRGTTGPAGDFSCNTTMPAAPLGTQIFSATAGPTATTTFTVQPSLSVSPGSGGAGTSATFSGAGYPASTWVNVTWTGATYCNGTTGASGGFSCSLLIPAGTAGGGYLFTGTDALRDKATTTFLVVTGLLDDPDHGPAGTAVTLNGSNFADNVAATVTWGSTAICPGATTNATGGFSCAYTIPAGTPGGTTVFSATAGGVTASVQFVVTFLGSVPTGLTPGASVNLSGGGYVPGVAFTITAPWGLACGGTSSPAGTVACTASVPMDASPGEYNFTAATGTDTASSPFGLFTIGTPTANLPSVDVGQPVEFSVVAAGGTGTLTYSWLGLPSGCPKTGSTVSCTPTAPLADGSITVQVTDTAGFNVTSKALAYSVFAAPTQGPASPSRAGADLGQTVNFTAAIQYGSGGGSYSWTATGLGCTASTGPTLDCEPTSAGSYSVSYQYTDSNGLAATGSTLLTFVVSNPPTQSAPTAAPGSVDLGQTVGFTAQVGAGSGGGSYAWSPSSSGLGCVATTANVIDCKPTATGTYTISFQWTDSNGVLASGTAELTGFVVYADPTVSVPVPSPSTVSYVYVGGTVTFTTTSSSQGSGGLTYAWTAPAGLGCPATTHTSSISCVPIAAGSFSVSVTATDSNDFTTAPATLASAMPVYAVPTVSPIVLSRPGADEGQSITLSTTGSGGDGILKYTWATPGLIDCSSSAATIICTAGSTAGSYTLSVFVSDTNSVDSATATVNLNVSAKPSLSAPAPTPDHTISGSPTGDVGQTFTFTTAPTGGAGTFTYTWSVPSELGCVVEDSATITCSPTTAGAWTLSVSAMDGNGMMTAEASTTFHVLATPAVGVVSPTRSGTAVTSADTHQTLEFGTTATGGTGTYTYTWTVNGVTIGTTASTGLNCTYKATTSNVSSITCIPIAAGAYTVNVSAVDSIGGASTVSTSGAFVVLESPVVVLVVTPSSVLDGKSVTFNATITGGIGPFTYVWNSLPSGCTPVKGPVVTCTPTAVGTTTVSLTVTDANDGTGSGLTNLTVQASFLGLPATEGYEIVAGAVIAGIAALAVGLVLLVRHRRGRQQQLQF